MKKISGPLRLALAAALALPCGVAVSQETAPKPGFSMKEDSPATGSNIRRERVSGGSLPYDKAYGELTPAQQAIFKSRFMEMGDGDEPPFPLDGLGPLYSAISKVNQAVRGGFGRLEMDVYVDDTGAPTKVDVIQSPDDRLAKHAATIAMLTKFKPALCKGKPCAMGFPVGINFVRR